MWSSHLRLPQRTSSSFTYLQESQSQPRSHILKETLTFTRCENVHKIPRCICKIGSRLHIQRQRCSRTSTRPWVILSLQNLQSFGARRRGCHDGDTKTPTSLSSVGLVTRQTLGKNSAAVGHSVLPKAVDHKLASGRVSKVSEAVSNPLLNTILVHWDHNLRLYENKSNGMCLKSSPIIHGSS